MLDFLKKNETPVESYWSILIESEWVTSAIWQIKDNKVEVISSSPGTRWEADLTEAVDATLSSCTQNLSDDFIDPTKTVFGVSSTWIQDGNIKEEYLLKLKKICQDLSLTPSGFVVLSEAISHFMKNREQSLFSGITLGISDQSLDLSVFNMGKLLGTTVVSRSVSISDDLIEGLSRLTSDLENFPAKIVLYNQKETELEEIKNSLNEIDWEKVDSLKFMHAPKIEILNPVDKILAVSLAGGSEISQVDNVSFQEVKNENINDVPEEEIKNIEEPIGVTAQDLGFVVDNPTFKPKINLPKLFIKLPKLPKINFSFSGRPLVFGGIFLLVIFIILFLMWWFLPKATVTIFVLPKKIEDSINLNFENGLTDDTIETSVSGEKTKSTTGTKTVGEKAKGSVEIKNNTPDTIKLSTGTILTSSSDLQFVLIKTASVSGSVLAGTYGKETVDIEAKSIGSEYNLAKDEVFKISNYPKGDIAAFSTNTFSGGSSRQISAVSEDDRKKLLNDLMEELTNQAKSKFIDQLTDERILIDSSIAFENIDEEFSNKVGDEATTIKLSLNLKFTAITVSKNDLSTIAKKTLEEKIPSGFILRDDQILYVFSEQKEKEVFEVKITANLLPSVDTVDIAKKITGRYPTIAEGYLQSVPGFINVEFRLPSLLRGNLATLPHVSRNIEIILSSEQ